MNFKFLNSLIKPTRTGIILFGFLLANELIQFHTINLNNLFYILGLSLMAFIIEIARFYKIDLNNLTATTKQDYKTFKTIIF